MIKQIKSSEIKKFIDKNPNTVFIKGRKLNRKTLDLFKAKAKDRKNLTATAVRYLEAQIFN